MLHKQVSAFKPDLVDEMLSSYALNVYRNTEYKSNQDLNFRLFIRVVRVSDTAHLACFLRIVVVVGFEGAAVSHEESV